MQHTACVTRHLSLTLGLTSRFRFVSFYLVNRRPCSRVVYLGVGNAVVSTCVSPAEGRMVFFSPDLA